MPTRPRRRSQSTPQIIGQPPVVTIRATSKNQPHPYFVSYRGIPDEAAWPVRDLCKAYGWPDPPNSRDFPGGATIALIERSGSWSPDDVEKFFAAQGLMQLPNATDHSADGGVTDNSKFKVADEKADPEVALDIQLASAAYTLATGRPATIRVYWTKDLASGLRAATADQCDVCCITWGADEKSYGQGAANVFNAAAEAAVSSGMIIVAAAGDNDSSDGGTTPANVDFPASSPYVIGCGGTKLYKPEGNAEDRVGSDDSHRELREEVWNNDPGDPNGEGTGGGFSEFFSIPDWQLGTVQATMRMVPDVAAHADPRTGYRIFVNGEDLVTGGTSASAALYAGLFAAFGPKRGFITPELYKNQVCFNDVRNGDNGMFRALVGPDACTGLGSPKGARLAERIGSDAATLKRVRRLLAVQQVTLSLSSAAFGLKQSLVDSASLSLKPRFVPAPTDARSIVYSEFPDIGPAPDPVQTDLRPLSDFGINDIESAQYLVNDLDTKIQMIPGFSNVRLNPNQILHRCKTIGDLITIVRQALSQ